MQSFNLVSPVSGSILTYLGHWGWGVFDVIRYGNIHISSSLSVHITDTELA